MNAALKAPDVVAFLKDNGIDAAPGTPAEFGQLHRGRAEEVDADHQEVEHQGGMSRRGLAPPWGAVTNREPRFPP